MTDARFHDIGQWTRIANAYAEAGDFASAEAAYLEAFYLADDMGLETEAERWLAGARTCASRLGRDPNLAIPVY